MNETTPASQPSMFAPAVKAQLKARVAIDGPTGSGKTYTALQWARILAGATNPVGLIDTENRSAAYYAPTPGVAIERLNWWDPPYEFGHLPVSPPYSPIELRELIIRAGEELGGDGVLVIDSLTHFWNGEGGTLDIVDNASSRGNTFTGWKEGTPAQRAMLDAIVHARCHVIVTMRSKMEYLLVEELRNGKKVSVPTKVGMAPEQRAGVEYEFTVVADMDLEHRLVVSKSRCDLVADVVAPKGRSYEPAQVFAAWLSTGVEPIDTAQVDEIVAAFDVITDPETRKAAKADFVAVFGRPDALTSDRIGLAGEWIRARVTTTLRPRPASSGDTPTVEIGDDGPSVPDDLGEGPSTGPRSTAPQALLNEVRDAGVAAELTEAEIVEVLGARFGQQLVTLDDLSVAQARAGIEILKTARASAGEAR